ncbi:type I secretion system permease/ATPase [Rhizobium sp. S95]|uniref:Type I secretion system permease/ATPase n=1 Tax=Ciceribacter sichuanensis TaxID=2949647 RepID=A0AAJ1FA55_9HYPH|nr:MULTISPECIES: type I secretion system permease/ATPase [unclassified Ciceribacter]MCM2396061.1 type I secretion system permease/ATPase [Ciceribacter sp. S95]MCO5959918.1 type I secretion system permease/ATPase [Ciceribacter sp. S101]
MRRAFAGVAVFSGIMNLLGLAGPMFMLEVYDRVIPSRSGATLVALLLLVAGLCAFAGFLDIVRGRALSRIAGIFDARFSHRVSTIIASAPLRMRIAGDVLKPAHDAEQIRAFLTGPGPSALLDLPWMPIYLAISFFLHPLIGSLATGTMALLVVLTFASDLLNRRNTSGIVDAMSNRNRFGEAMGQNAEAIAAMGMLPEINVRWSEAHGRVAELQRKTGDTAAFFAGLSRTLRQMVQSGSLALGAWLVITGDMTGGSIVAASIIVARSLQPIEQIIGNWRNMISARAAWRRLQQVLKLFPEERDRTTLPVPSSSLTVEGLSIGPPGERQRLTVHNINFRANAGDVIGIVGPSASGKSSLVRAITGVWPSLRGRVCLDGASLDQWPAHARGRHIGYMPQSFDLFPDTIAQNIARLDRGAPHEEIVAAARAAGVHDMIVSLPDGYETQIGDGGVNLSAGQRQRVALARALYGNPFLVVLDEPNSNLDTEGDRALADAVASLREQGRIVMIVTHRNSILSSVDFLLVMERGTVKAFGPREVVLSRLRDRPSDRIKPARSAAAPELTVIDGEGPSHDR